MGEQEGAKAALELAEKLNISISKMTRLLTTVPGPLTKPVTKQTAEKLERLFTKLGVDVVLERETGLDLGEPGGAPAPEAAAPLLPDSPAQIELDADLDTTLGAYSSDRLPAEADAPKRKGLPIPLLALIAVILAVGVLLTSLQTGDSSLAGFLGARSVTDENPEIAALRRAAETGDAQAQLELAGRYGEGDGVAQSFAESARWLELAALQGEGEAQFLLGHYHLNGSGVEQSVQEAALWFDRAAAQDIPEASLELGKLLLTEGVEVEGIQDNQGAAERALARAAAQGLPEANDYLAALEDANVSAEAATEEEGAEAASTETTSEPGAAIVIGALSSSPEEVAAPATQVPEDLFEAIALGEPGLISRSLEAGAELEARDTYGQTPLMYAVRDAESLDVLLEAGADVNAQSDAGWTALMYAARDNAQAISVLLQRGADSGLLNSDGQSARDIAADANPEALELLE